MINFSEDVNEDRVSEAKYTKPTLHQIMNSFTIRFCNKEEIQN